MELAGTVCGKSDRAEQSQAGKCQAKSDEKCRRNYGWLVHNENYRLI